MGGVTFSQQPCFGSFSHAICNFNLFDLETLKKVSNKCLIGNKFSLDVDPLAIIVHWSNIISKSFAETGKISQPLPNPSARENGINWNKCEECRKPYENGYERNITRDYHRKIMNLINW